MRRLLACCLAATAACAGEADPLTALPVLPRHPAPPAVTLPYDPAAGTTLAPGVRLVPGERVVLDGTMQVDKGPVDGLEVVACLRDGKTHETMIRLTAAEGALIKAAGIAAFGLADGRPAEEGRNIPARGTPMRLTVLWRDEDNAWHATDAATLIRDRATDRSFPALPWVWTGSRMVLMTENGPDGKPVRREHFMLDSTRSLAVNYDEPDALLASPFPCADEDARFEVNSAIAPAPGTPIRLVLTRAEPVLELRLDAQGGLSGPAGILDDVALQAALAAAFAEAARPAHRGLFVRTADAVGDAVVTAARARLLRAAAAAKVWTVPVWVAE